jgi:hypothetical protein
VKAYLCNSVLLLHNAILCSLLLEDMLFKPFSFVNYILFIKLFFKCFFSFWHHLVGRRDFGLIILFTIVLIRPLNFYFYACSWTSQCHLGSILNAEPGGLKVSTISLSWLKEEEDGLGPSYFSTSRHWQQCCHLLTHSLMELSPS